MSRSGTVFRIGLVRPLSRCVWTALALLVCACTSDEGRVSRSFPANGIGKVLLRGTMASTAMVNHDNSTSAIVVSGMPSGEVIGYHPVDQNWKATPSDKWGFDFVAQQYGDVLVISTKGEIDQIHHHYKLLGLRIWVPDGVQVDRQDREYGNTFEPDLRLPGSPPILPRPDAYRKNSSDR